jgi:hypothetical protein
MLINIILIHIDITVRAISRGRCANSTGLLVEDDVQIQVSF